MLTRYIIAAIITLFAPFAAHAHEGRPIYVEIAEQGEGRFELRWKIPPVVSQGSEPLIRLTGTDCGIVAGEPKPSLIGTHLYSCAGAPDAVELRYPGINPVLSTLVLYRTLDGNEQSLIASPDEALISLPKDQTPWDVISQYTYNGVEHILEGYDHLLFVLCLMLLSGNLKRIFFTVTGFTLGHSVTLGMSALAGWSLPPTFVEPLIAFSILILAAEVAAKRKETLAYRYPVLIASGFGLLHGFGFGGALAEIGLPYGMQIQALAFFNLGVELGQILFVIVAFTAYRLTEQAMKMVRTTIRAEDLRPIATYPAGFIAAYWTIERVIGIWL